MAMRENNKRLQTETIYNEQLAYIDQRERDLIKDAIQKENQSKALSFRAAAIIQSSARSKLTRIKTLKLKHRHRSAIIIQSNLRGKNGRRLARQAKWKKDCVASTPYALKSIRMRSKEITAIGDWIELYDPYTNYFWFLNKNKKSEDGVFTTCWEAPTQEYEKEFVCCFEITNQRAILKYPNQCQGNEYIGQVCGKCFKNRKEYNSHRLHDHTWECPSCNSINTGLTYPKCFICGNSRGANGEDIGQRMKNITDKMHER